MKNKRISEEELELFCKIISQSKENKDIGELKNFLNKKFKGWDINSAKDKHGLTLLYICVTSSWWEEATKLLLEYSHDINIKHDITHKGKETFLTAASKSPKNTNIMKLLLNHKANINQQSGDGGTALHNAVKMEISKM